MERINDWFEYAKSIAGYLADYHKGYLPVKDFEQYCREAEEIYFNKYPSVYGDNASEIFIPLDLERIILSTDSSARLFVLNRIQRHIDDLATNIANIKLNLFIEGVKPNEVFANFCNLHSDYISATLLCFAHETHTALYNIVSILRDVGLYINLPSNKNVLWFFGLNFEDNNISKSSTNNNTPDEAKENTLRISYRRAALLLLFEKTSICKDIDKTRIAKFIEAVVGGNITKLPQNTDSYKRPTKQAMDNAYAMLKDIGIE